MIEDPWAALAVALAGAFVGSSGMCILWGSLCLALASRVASQAAEIDRAWAASATNQAMAERAWDSCQRPQGVNLSQEQFDELLGSLEGQRPIPMGVGPDEAEDVPGRPLEDEGDPDTSWYTEADPFEDSETVIDCIQRDPDQRALERLRQLLHGR